MRGNQLKRAVEKLVWLAAATLLLSSCSAFQGNGFFSFLNPVAEVETLEPPRGYGAATDRRPRAASVAGVTVERTPTGLLLRMNAAVPAAGYSGLVFTESRDTPPGLLELRLRLLGGSSGALMQVPASVFVAGDRLAGLTAIHLVTQAGVVVIPL